MTDFPLQVESKLHPHVPRERAHLFHSWHDGTTEREYLALLQALICVLKPASILETGTYYGVGTLAIARAIKTNGFGRLVSVDNKPECIREGRSMVHQEGVANVVDFAESDSIEFLKITNRKFDFAFFDTLLSMRCKEFSTCMERGLLEPRTVVAFHDTSRLRTNRNSEPDEETKIFWKDFLALPGIQFIEFPLSRGLIVAQIA